MLDRKKYQASLNLANAIALRVQRFAGTMLLIFSLVHFLFFVHPHAHLFTHQMAYYPVLYACYGKFVDVLAAATDGLMLKASRWLLVALVAYFIAYFWMVFGGDYSYFMYPELGLEREIKITLFAQAMAGVNSLFLYATNKKSRCQVIGKAE